MPWCECCGAPVVDGVCGAGCEHPPDEDWHETCGDTDDE